jgi:hypothetical protein
MSRNVASDVQAIFCRRRHQPRRPPLAKIRAGPACRPAHADASLRSQWSTIAKKARLSAKSATAIVPLIDAANVRAIMVSVVSKAWTAV